MPDVPTINETLPGIELASWLGVATTPGTPRPNPVVVKLTDANDLPYPNVRILATGGAVSPANALTGPDGRASFTWTPTSEPLNALQFRVEGSASPIAEAFALSRPAFASTSVLNAASFRPGIVPGSIATIFGANLFQPTVIVEGARAQVFYADDRQINFAVPSLTQTSATASLQVQTALGTANAAVPLFAVQPGIFFDAASGLVACAGVEEADALLASFAGHRFAPLLHHYELASWVLFARAYASRTPDPEVRAFDAELRAAADPVERLAARWIGRPN
jgi:hypothetical protein